ncbi:epoxide hydrolase [Moniliophthora roreri MCA 2997]|uniref:Epoxide hydrolase n=1 Tax=Moniliophthora roreri (strain MCA 2997) TaxID=1381753 RepID=V2WTZ0_MONRO|nr:epoxide hydrolase [Moniliophthora roreri MCA 2997]
MKILWGRGREFLTHTLSHSVIPESTVSTYSEEHREEVAVSEWISQHWADGTLSDVLSELVGFWKSSFDWGEVENELNQKYKVFSMELEEAGESLSAHLVHHRSPRCDAILLLFLHGWPGNFQSQVDCFLPLTDPTDSNTPAFHVVAPSLPGFTFSSALTRNLVLGLHAWLPSSTSPCSGLGTPITLVKGTTSAPSFYAQ